MGALLIAEWLGGDDDIVEVRDPAAPAQVRAQVARVAGEVGLDATASARLALAATELATNQLRHAQSGAMAVRAISRLGTPGVEVIAADNGRGMVELAAAVRGRDPKEAAPPGAGLGVGVSALIRNSDEVDFDVRAQEGTCVRLRTFRDTSPVRTEVAILGRPISGEPVSGDHAIVVRTATITTMAVFDGLGHGPAAREASNRAVAAVRTAAADGARPDDILYMCDRALEGSRGASGAIAAIDHERRTLTWSAAGDVLGTLCGASTQRLIGTRRVLGTRGGRGPKLGLEVFDFGERSVLCIATDGIVSRAIIDDEPMRLRQHPAMLAHHVVQTYARGTDDLLVLVAR
jgi:anti-sigma regulatory factor (Ser/Thr protein kinase)